MNFEINKELTSKIYELSYREKIPVIMATNDILKKYNSHAFLDHGCMVPLYFINKYYKSYKLVHITYAALGDTDLYNFGINIGMAVQKLNENAILIASGDLSHRLKEDGPYGYNPCGEKFDREFLSSLKNGDVKGVFTIDKKTVYNAGECGRRSVIMMLGALEGKKFNGEILSYEGPFGVGYGVVKFNVISQGSFKLKELEALREQEYAKKKSEKDPFVKLARESLTKYLDEGEMLEDFPEYVTEEMKNTKRGIFVSLKKFGELRGCIGTIFPATSSIAEEIIHNVLEAGLNDPRFYEVQKEELHDIVFSVDVLTKPEMASREELNPRKYGIIVECRGKRGLLLPDLQGVDTVEKQLSIACDKACIDFNENYTIQKFEVIRHEEG